MRTALKVVVCGFAAIGVGFVAGVILGHVLIRIDRRAQERRIERSILREFPDGAYARYVASR